jgi:hypothetical protein
VYHGGYCLLRLCCLVKATLLKSKKGEGDETYSIRLYGTKRGQRSADTLGQLTVTPVNARAHWPRRGRVLRAVRAHFSRDDPCIYNNHEDLWEPVLDVTRSWTKAVNAVVTVGPQRERTAPVGIYGQGGKEPTGLRASAPAE